jgi:hypothetical protein
VTGVTDLNLPFATPRSSNSELSDDDIVAIVEAVRAAALPRWPIADVYPWNEGEAEVVLSGPRGPARPQMMLLRLKKEGARWSVIGER